MTERCRNCNATFGTILRIKKGFIEASKILIFIFLFCQAAYKFKKQAAHERKLTIQFFRPSKIWEPVPLTLQKNLAETANLIHVSCGLTLK
jgi:hypothetical protein